MSTELGLGFINLELFSPNFIGFEGKKVTFIHCIDPHNKEYPNGLIVYTICGAELAHTGLLDLAKNCSEVVSLDTTIKSGGILDANKDLALVRTSPDRSSEPEKEHIEALREEIKRIIASG